MAQAQGWRPQQCLTLGREEAGPESTLKSERKIKSQPQPLYPATVSLCDLGHDPLPP